MAETSLLEAGASAASTAAALENLQVEASCSVCLEYLKEPVIIECGHNFCKACITRWWEDLERDFPCPVCRKTSRYRSLRPNRQLGSMVEIAKQLQTVKRKIRDESLCSQHHEALSLFCYEDQEAVCLICAISHTHRAHTVVPLDDATQEYKEKLQKCLDPLEQKLQEITCCKASEEKKPGELKRLVESRRQQILKEFEELHRRLDEEQQTLLSRLEEEEQDILQRLRENAAHLGDKRRDLAHLAAEVEGKCLQSGFEMLKVRLCPCVGPRVRCSLALCRPTCQSEVYPLLLCFPKPRFLFQMCAKNLFLEWGTSDFHHPLKKLLYP